MLDPLLDLLWPRRCAACDSPATAGALCPPCHAALIPGTEHACPRCGGVYLTPPPGGGDHPCGPCIKAPPPFARARGAFAYGGPLRDAVVRWKSRPDHTLGPGLVGLMLSQAEAAGWGALPPSTLVVPIPSPYRQVIRRGFNPAGLLARGLSRHLGLRLAPALRLAQHKASSQGLGRARRARRVRGIFSAHPRALRGAPVLLVDDVMTTGATVRAASRACRRVGAVRMEIAVLARAPLDG